MQSAPSVAGVIPRLPGALVELFCLRKKFLVFNLVSRNLKTKYRRSFLGFFWTLLGPMAMAGVYYFVFKVVLQVRTPDFFFFIVTGTLFWSFFGSTLIEGMEGLVNNRGLVSKIPLPIQVFTLVGATTNLSTLLSSVPVILAAGWVAGAPLGLPFVLVFYYAAVLFLLAYGISLTLSIGYAMLRDLRHIMTIALQLWFYATPVLYEESMIPEPYRAMLYVNPAGMLFSGLKTAVVRGEWPSVPQLFVPLLWALAALGVAEWVRRRVGPWVVERL